MNNTDYCFQWGLGVAQWLRHCATIRTVSLGTFSVVPPTEACALRSTQLPEVSTRDFSWGKGGRCVWLTTYHPCGAKTSRKSGALNLPEPLGPPRPVAGDLYLLLLMITILRQIFSSKEIILLMITILRQIFSSKEII